MKFFQNGINQVCTQIIRPLRADYRLFDMGPTVENDCYRTDFDLVNHCQQRLKVSLWNRTNSSNICIIYLHSANGCRLEALRYVQEAMKNNYMFISFDFSGSGMSDGDCVTYGFKEIYDLQTVITHILQFSKQIILWGRSMGSVIALLYMQQFQTKEVKCLILDSPFICLQDVVVYMAYKRTKIPNFILTPLSSYISDEIKKLCGFSLESINCLEKIKNNCIPAYFITSKLDTVVPNEQTEKLFNAYMGNKTLYYTNQDHNATRDNIFLDKIFEWLKIHISTQKIKMIQQQIPIKMIDLNCFYNKERSTTFDDCRIATLSPKPKLSTTRQVLQTQRSAAFLDRSISGLQKEQSRSKQQNYFQNKPILITKIPSRTRDSSLQKF